MAIVTDMGTPGVTQFAWREGRRFAASAQTIGEVLDRLTEENGGTLPTEAVVREAKKKTSPLHPLFPWDVKEAAEKHWLDVARKIVNSITVKVTFSGDLEPRRIQCFVSIARDDRRPNERAYVPTRMLADDTELHQAALRDALRLLRSWQRRFSHLQELKPLFDKIDGFEPSDVG